jgi:hypothetical protein
MQIQLEGGTTVTSGNASAPAGYVNAFNERIFRVARNSNTKTATITAASFVRGGPAVLATASASTNGFDIVQPTSSGGNAVNNMLIGVVYDYPDTSQARNGVWQPEDVGLVQCYGLHTAILCSVASTSIAGGVLMAPNSVSMFATSPNPVIGALGTETVATNLGPAAGIAGLVVLAQSVASQAAGSAAVVGFIRCM